jgi:hypothetical protein
MTPSIKPTYFVYEGAVEPIRLALALSGTPYAYEDAAETHRALWVIITRLMNAEVENPTVFRSAYWPKNRGTQAACITNP